MGPAQKRGFVQVHFCDEKKQIFDFEAFYNETIQNIMLTSDGNIVAVAAESGTMIKLFNPSSGELLRELRRGKDAAYIRSISIDMETKLLACSSNKGTVHVFSLENQQKQDESSISNSNVNSNIAVSAQNTKSRLSMFGSFLPSYFSSEFSFTRLRLHENSGEN